MEQHLRYLVGRERLEPVAAAVALDDQEHAGRVYLKRHRTAIAHEKLHREDARAVDPVAQQGPQPVALDHGPAGHQNALVFVAGWQRRRICGRRLLRNKGGQHQQGQQRWPSGSAGHGGPHYNSGFACRQLPARATVYALYSLVLRACLVGLLPYALVQVARGQRSAGALWQRLRPVVPPVAPGGLWVHSVSVGEAVAAVPLVERLRARFPDRPLIVSTTTETGQQVARRRLPADAFLYFPLDLPGAVKRALARIRPAVVVIMETEIWPNFLRAAHEQGVPVIFASARISPRSFRRYRWLGRWTAQVLAGARWLLAQTEEDAARLRALGAPAERVRVVGNLKFDVPPPAALPVADWLEAALAGRRPVLVAGSVVAGEEPAVLEAFAQVRARHRQALLLLAPRRPERFEEAARLAAAQGWRVERRSQLASPEQAAVADVLVLDSLGELAALYQLADAVFVGGSLVPAGGHNLLEPAQWARVPVFGPHVENFAAMARAFLDAGAALQVPDGAGLAQAWLELLAEPERRQRMGERAAAVAAAHRGATERVVAHIAATLEEAGS